MRSIPLLRSDEWMKQVKGLELISRTELALGSCLLESKVISMRVKERTIKLNNRTREICKTKPQFGAEGAQQQAWKSTQSGWL